MSWSNQTILQLIWVLVIAAVALLLQGWIGRRITQFALQNRIPGNFTVALRVIIRWLILTVAAIIGFHVLGIEIGNAWTLLSTILAMVAVGFVAAWSLLSNTLAFFVLIIWNHWRIGNTIQVMPENLQGVVEDMDLMFTRLRTPDGGVLIVPNNIFLQRFVKVEPAIQSHPISS